MKGELAPWRPFKELERMRREMDRLWESFFEERPRRKIEELGGEKKQEKEEKEENYHFIERSYGAFSRSIRLPREVQSDKINASYKNGLLKVTLPKSEEAKKKEIKIKVE
jgi:HSP20 family protein